MPLRTLHDGITLGILGHLDGNRGRRRRHFSPGRSHAHGPAGPHGPVVEAVVVKDGVPRPEADDRDVVRRRHARARVGHGPRVRLARGRQAELGGQLGAGAARHVEPVARDEGVGRHAVGLRHRLARVDVGGDGVGTGAGPVGDDHGAGGDGGLGPVGLRGDGVRVARRAAARDGGVKVGGKVGVVAYGGVELEGRGAEDAVGALERGLGCPCRGDEDVAVLVGCSGNRGSVRDSQLCGSASVDSRVLEARDIVCQQELVCHVGCCAGPSGAGLKTTTEKAHIPGNTSPLSGAMRSVSASHAAATAARTLWRSARQSATQSTSSSSATRRS